MNKKADNKPVLSDDGERMVPYHHKGQLMYAEHLTRYQAVMDLVKGKVVLDIASGSGYGTKLISAKAKKVYGVDVSTEAIEYSEKQYGAQNITYLLGNGEEIPLEDNSVDVVVTFETIEHIENYKKFLDEISRVLKDDGIAIVSTPNDLEFYEGNHFHLHEFTESELTNLLKKKFKFIHKYYQATWKAVGIGNSDLFEKEGQASTTLEIMSTIDPKQYLYFYFVCSNKEINTTIQPIVAIGEHYSDRKMYNQRDELAELNTTVSSYMEKNTELTKSNKELTEQLQHVTSELESVYASRSWRFTRLLRSIKDGTRGKR
jgi:ubiquinone/menaquinone biosynthesis C-methylase UbiE